MTTRLRYPLASLLPDILRATAGLAICLTLILFTAPVSVIFYALTGLSLLLGWLAAHALWRSRTIIEMDAGGVTQEVWILPANWAKPWRRRITWQSMSRFKLRYYSTRRERDRGWITVALTGDGGTLRADSDLENFEQFARTACRAAMRAGAEIDSVSHANAAQLFPGEMQ